MPNSTANLLTLAPKIALIGLVSVFFVPSSPSHSQPRVLTIEIEIVDQVDPAGLPPHLQRIKPVFLANLHKNMQAIFKALGRCEILDRHPDLPRADQSHRESGAVDIEARVTVLQLYKSYRNKLFLGTHDDINVFDEFYYAPGTEEVIAEPVIVGRLELDLVDARKGKRFWSRLSDSTATIPYHNHRYIINPAKHPGATHPELLQNHMADILRLSNVPGSPLRYSLDAADRWFISAPRDDIHTARGLLKGLAASFYTAVDSHLPLEGQVVELLPEEKGKRRVLLNIGATHGVVPGLKFEVRRPLPASQKVGQIQVIKVDSTTAIARVRKIDRHLRKRGEGLQPGDRAISKKRKSTRTRSAVERSN